MRKKILLLTGLVVILIITYGLIGQIFSTLHSGDRLEQATNELNKLQMRNKELKTRLEQVKSDYFVETKARNELNLGREGETVVIIPDEKINQFLGKDKKPIEVRLPNWQGWWRLFFK